LQIKLDAFSRGLVKMPSDYVTAIGAGALHGNTTASHNTATGYISLYNNTTGSLNVADGDRASVAGSLGSPPRLRDRLWEKGVACYIAA